MHPLYTRMLVLALTRPWLIPRLVATTWAFRARGWHRRPPFLPLPPASYLRWRMETAYGDPEASPPKQHVIRYLRWAAEMRGRM